MSEQDADFLGRALAEAKAAALRGEVPIGAVVVSAAGAVLASASNRIVELKDPTAHAEILVLREAAQKLGNERLIGTTLYVSLEPCAMCAGALVNARISRLVFGASDPKAGAVQSMFGIGTDSRLNHRFDVVGGVCAEDGAQRLRAFFAKLRAEGQK